MTRPNLLYVFIVLPLHVKNKSQYMYILSIVLPLHVKTSLNTSLRGPLSISVGVSWGILTHFFLLSLLSIVSFYVCGEVKIELASNRPAKPQNLCPFSFNEN